MSGFQGKDIVLVEDEDGFDVPMRITEVVVVGDEDYDTRHVVEVKRQEAAGRVKPEEGEQEPADRPVTFRAKPEERRGGDKLSAYLAFVPMNVKELSDTRFESYFVNDSNYYMRYVYMTAENNAWQVRAMGEVEPNTKEFIEEFGRDSLNDLERVCVQMMAYKREKPFLLKPVVDVQVCGHCNLRCAGCMHFAPVAEESFLDLGEFERDLERLSSVEGVGDYFGAIVLMGGEPLLHPHIAEVIRMTHRYLPESLIALCTNGLLLRRMGGDFWDALAECEGVPI